MIKKIIQRIKKNEALSDLTINSFWSLIGTFISKFLLFIVWIFVAKILEAKLYGEFSIIRSTTMLFADFVASSIGLIGTNYIAKYWGKDSSKVQHLIGLFNTFSFLLGAVLFVLSFSLSNVIASEMLHRTDLSVYLKASSIVIFISSISNNQFGILRGFNQYKIISKVTVWQMLCSFPVYFIATYYYSLEGAVFAYVFYNLIVCILTEIYLRQLYKKLGIRPSYENMSEGAGIICSFVLPYIFASCITAFLSWYNETRLVSLPNGFEEMGYYSILNVIVLIVIGVAFMVCIPFVSIMSKYQESNNITILKKLNMYLPMQVALLLVVPCIFFAEIITFIYGDAYKIEKIKEFSNFIFFVSYWQVYRQAVARFVAVKEKTWLYFADSVLYTSLSVILFKILYDYGVSGFTWSLTGATLINFIVCFPLYIWKDIIPSYILKDTFFLFLLIVPILVFGLSFIDISFGGRIIICIFLFVVNCLYFYKQLKLR